MYSKVYVVDIFLVSIPRANSMQMGDSPFGDGDGFQHGQAMIWTQDHDVEVGGVQYPATNAIYNNVFWPEKGIVFANDNHNPDAMIRDGKASKDPWKDDKGKALPIVKLKQWSDLQFLTWKSITTMNQRQNLRWVFRRNVINPMTVKMISEVMAKRGLEGKIWGNLRGIKVTEAPTWPGFQLRPGEEGFDALVGSPNSYGVCWMLIQ